MTKISVDKLMSMMADPTLDESALSEYFLPDEENSGPFDPKLKLNPDKVDLPTGTDALQRSAALMNSANWFAKMHRKNKFHKKIAEGYTGPIIITEGDSWFQYPVFLKDIVDHLQETYAILSLGAAGDLLKNMADEKEYVKALQDTGASILLLSGGGNDLVAAGALALHLEEYDPDLTPEDYLLPSFQKLLDEALGHYGRMFQEVHQLFPHVSILCHGYDYPVPNKDRWLGKPMESRGILDRTLQKGIAAVMMDQFNRRLRRLAKTMPHVTYIDCRGVVLDHRWHDGLHPTDDGYAAVAAKFDWEIKRLANTRSAPPIIIDGPFGSAKTLSRAMQSPPVIAGGQPKGYSLHVGLNTVDPGHYAGWDGKLFACEADALAMQDLATNEGFSPQLLLTPDATRQNVIDQIERAARDLQPGDMFLFTVSGHGGRIPDFNRDEDHDGDQPMDETLCLYDFQLADDELYMFWTKFREGVRVLMVPDTCHSGSMVKVGRSERTSLFGRPLNIPGVRAMPGYIEDTVVRANEAAYREASDSYSALKESVLTNPQTTPIKASVLNLGACDDNQFAMDGANHGAFTGALLEIWNNGRFSGGYHQFRELIDTRIGSASQTPTLFEQLHRHPEFIGDRPFSLQPGRPASSGFAAPRPASVCTSMRSIEEGEGEETDQIPDAEVDAILQSKARGTGFRSGTTALSWPDYAEFDRFIKSLNLNHFSTDEFLILGGAHSTPGGNCAGRNSYPPRALWPNIARTAEVLDHLRDRLGKSIAITNAYRAPAYNACIGGATGSKHMTFNALDFKVADMPAPKVAEALRWLRDKEGFFTGGIGRYNGFTHIDTRPNSTTWPPAFRDSPLPASSPLIERAPNSLKDRIDRLVNAVLSEPRGPRSRKAPGSAFATATSRSGDDFDPGSQVEIHQQSLQAAVDASSVVSFVENLTPGQKEDVLLSTLFAQRAADAKADPITERAAWHSEYLSMLGIMGWTRESQPFEASQKMKGSGSFDKVILATLAQVATGNQFKIVESAIEALRGLAADDGNIKLFDFETSSTTGGNFQIGSAEAAGDVISLALGAFNFTFKDKKQNILFVSWGKNELDYWLSASRMSLSPTIYADVRETVKSKLADSRQRLISDIKLA